MMKKCKEDEKKRSMVQTNLNSTIKVSTSNAPCTDPQRLHTIFVVRMKLIACVRLRLFYFFRDVP
jgi:hypothetical protein